MELVYLWVEEYKNIKKQGFNFSPRFKCEFKDEYDENDNLKDNCELEIIDKEKIGESYPKNFFGENINITAIVGENGSGKTRILNSIIESIKKESHTDFKYLLVYRINELKYISNIKVKCNLKKENLYNAICTGVHKKDIDDREVYQAHHYSSANLHFIKSNRYEIANILSVETGKDNTSFSLATFMYLPIEIEIQLKDSEDLIIENINFISNDRDSVRRKFDSIEKSDYYHHYLFINYLRKSGIKSNIEILGDRDKLKNELFDVLNENDFNKYFLRLKQKEIFHISSLKDEEKDIYLRKDGFWEFFHFDFIDEKNRRYNDLSHGEQMIFGQLLNIYFYKESNEEQLFLFDEPEISLHPNWQKKYLEELISLLNKLNKKYHFIFSSHSSFLLSDIPKENIIFLEKDEGTGDCINATEKMKGFNTFGANIHTLLSHGFFMKDGLMGEFAKNKINNVLKFLKEEESEIQSEEKALSIIKIIGEPFLKEKLMKMYNDKFKTNEEKIEELQAEIERLRNA